jgi:hypothetical protein
MRTLDQGHGSNQVLGRHIARVRCSLLDNLEMTGEVTLERDIRNFFDKYRVADLLLPDGWFGGRPMEAHFRLTFVSARPKRLVLELDDHILLSISGPLAIQEVSLGETEDAGTPALRLSAFSQAVLDYVEFGGDKPSFATYGSGTIHLVAPVGLPERR